MRTCRKVVKQVPRVDVQVVDKEAPGFWKETVARLSDRRYSL